MTAVPGNVFPAMAVPLPDHELLEDRLSLAGAALAPAETHGVICGLLCIGGRQAAVAWITEQSAEFAGDHDDVEAAAGILTELEEASWQALLGSEMQFMPVLPDDDQEVRMRAEALGQWCLGFVAGLALGGWSETGAGGAAGEIREIVDDFSAICNVGIDDEDDDEESAESSLMELTEYVRVGVQFIFETLAVDDDGPAPPTIH